MQSLRDLVYDPEGETVAAKLISVLITQQLDNAAASVGGVASELGKNEWPAMDIDVQSCHGCLRVCSCLDKPSLFCHVLWTRGCPCQAH